LTNLLGAESAATHPGLAAASGETQALGAVAIGARAERIVRMIQTSVAAPLPVPLQPETGENDLPDPLWRLAGDMGNARVLIVAQHGLDLMCGLIRRGCLAATVLRLGDKPDSADYDVVFIPLAPSADDVVRLAGRALAPNGRLIAGVRNATAAAALARRLRLNGFSTPHAIHLPDLVLLRANARRPS
jgi:hypothetical protein